MAEVKILIEGYGKEVEGSDFFSATTTLIKNKGKNIIVDPGVNRSLLLKILKKENLSPKDINYVILTHYHLDHSLLSGLFENAKILDNSDCWSWDGKMEQYDQKKIFGKDINVIQTPGHDRFHCSVLVDTKDGKIAIVGDVFWWKDNQRQEISRAGLLNHEDEYVKDLKALKLSRKKVLQMADWIIPGHGKIFKVKK